MLSEINFSIQKKTAVVRLNIKPDDTLYVRNTPQYKEIVMLKIKVFTKIKKNQCV